MSEPTPTTVIHEVDQNGGTVFYRNGKRVSAIWGPAVDGCWYACPSPSEVHKVASREEALAIAKKPLEVHP